MIGAIVATIAAAVTGGMGLVVRHYSNKIKMTAVAVGFQLDEVRAGRAAVAADRAQLGQLLDEIQAARRLMVEEARAVAATEQLLTAQHRELRAIDHRRRIEMGLTQEVSDPNAT